MDKYLEETDDVYSFQEPDSDSEKKGVYIDQEHNSASDKRHFNSDELYFDGTDVGVWQQRTVESEDSAYDKYYGPAENEGYYGDAEYNPASTTAYEGHVFQRALGKIRLARASGATDVELTPEELEIYQARLWGHRASAACPQAIGPRPLSVVEANNSASTGAHTTSSNAGVAGTGSPRSKKGQRRSSMFASRSKKDKLNSRSRADSNATETINQQFQPGSSVPGPNGQPAFTPINTYQSHHSRDTKASSASSPSLPESPITPRSTGNTMPERTSAAGSARAARHASAALRILSYGDMPGAFPGSPVIHRTPTSPQFVRPSPSSSQPRIQSNLDIEASSAARSQSSLSQQPPKLVPFPVTEYKHYTAEPFQYQSAGHLAQPASQPQYARRIAPGPTYTSMPRRVSVPGQHTMSGQDAQGSHFDRNIPSHHHEAEASDEHEHEHEHRDDIPSEGVSLVVDDNAYRVQSMPKESSSGGSIKDGERKRKSGKSRRKH